MSTVPRSKLYTFDDFCALVKDGQKADLIDGVIYMASPENSDANDIGGWLYVMMRLYVRKKGLGRVFMSRVAYQLDDINGPEPDVGFVSTERLSRVRRGRVQGPPDLAVEVVSPDSVERDYVKKRVQYESSGVREYWIIDDLKEKVLLLRLDANEKYRVIRPGKGKLTSTVIRGFYIRSEWLWLETQPDPLDALNEILASS